MSRKTAIAALWLLAVLPAHADDAGPVLVLAQEAQRHAAAVEEARKAGSEMAVSDALLVWQKFEMERGDLLRARELAAEALAIRERLAPGSLAEASALNALAVLLLAQSDLAGARALYEKALDIAQRQASESLEVAVGLNGLAVILYYQSDGDGARKLAEQSLDLCERVAPQSLEMADALYTLGRVQWRVGDLDGARTYFQKSLEMRRAVVPDSVYVARALNGMGVIAKDQGNTDGARDYYLEALRILERKAPESLEHARVLNNVGRAAFDQGDFAEGERIFLHALSIRERLTPDGTSIVQSLQELADVAEKRGDLRTARQYLLRGAALQERHSPDGLSVADLYFGLGWLAFKQGDLAAAREQYLRALSIQERLAPRHWGLARTLSRLGQVARAQGDLAAAEQLYLRSVAVLESSREQSGGTQARTSYSERVGKHYYPELISVQAELGKPGAALHTLERSRSRSLLEHMAERDIDWSRTVPEAPRRRMEELRSRRERVASLLSGSEAATPREQVEQWQREFARLDAEEDALAQDLRRSVPDYAAVAYPQPVELAEIVESLAAGTLLLAWSTGEKEAVLLALLKESGDRYELRSERIALGAAALADRVGGLRQLMMGEGRLRAIGGIAEKAPQPIQQPAGAWVQAGSELYRDLLAPVEPFLSKASSLLLVPDGPLYELPFAALRGGPAGELLARRLPISLVPSMTLYRQLKQRRPAEGAAALDWAGLGDPAYPEPGQTPAAGGSLQKLLGRGRYLERLPGTRAELEAVGRVFERSRIRLVLGADATKQAVKSLPRSTSIVHLACHGLLDEHVPMNSALAFSMPEDGGTGPEDGLLHAWEIVQDVRLDSDLVVLSACQTGLGKIEAGEGLLGLTRAFLFAGARSLLVSLWPIADESAPLFMNALYGALLAGQTKDEALRQAQVRMLESGTFADPFFWAAFQIVGDAAPLPAGRRPHSAAERDGAP